MVKFPAHLLEDKLAGLAETDRGLSKGVRMRRGDDGQGTRYE
jgi:hypothetical protein